MVLNYKLILKVDAAIGILLAVAMIPSLIVSLLYNETDAAVAFARCIAPMLLLGSFAVYKIRPTTSTLHMRDGFLIVASSWILASIFGSVPFLLSHTIPSFVDAFFETASGFSTTGSTILTNIELLPKGILFWRSFTHWLGGMGILVFAIALLPALGIGGQRIIRAETPGPTLDKLSPKISDTARILYSMYFGMTLLEVILLCLGGVSLYDSLVHTFGTVGTGGLSSYNDSIAHFNSIYVDIVITIFMVLAGINFNLYYLLLQKRIKDFFSDYELRGYLLIIGIATILIALNLWFTKTYDTIGESLRYSVFQAASITTTTGYGTADFNLWPTFSKMVLFLLMFVGGSSSSTGGGVKVIRVLILLKLIRRGIYRKLHPRAIVPVKIQGRSIPSDTVSGITSFAVLYVCLLLFGSLVISLENFDMMTSISSVAACLGNIGPGFELVGPSSNYSMFSDFSKMFLSFYMLIGRLELFTIILLFSKLFWNPDR
ncbi:TrkH family potassium uptake protein [Sinanaerobacter sp. ZZT-01]|uniref:TrkH family potassium uptake protein n=1 Tax=Sinanaerobacter sp. ZZT-01 TaxID=3111540 RepID=UPI002D79F467|nr:TrkH family potassium uptake protein [Sinanaerobacter sp. ZZT-01]WRR93445.1 TrkH family potassium uptake protein [Sinanaerobacter sp. ZZT-01]